MIKRKEEYIVISGVKKDAQNKPQRIFSSNLSGVKKKVNTQNTEWREKMMFGVLCSNAIFSSQVCLREK